MKNRILQNRFEGVLKTLLTKNGMFAKLTGKNNYPPVLKWNLCKTHRKK